MPSLLEQKFLAHNRTSNLVLCVSLYLHLMDQVRWELIMEPEAIREGKRLLIYGLYWKDGDFFEKAYPAKAWEQPGLLHFSLKEQLMYLLLFVYCYLELFGHSAKKFSNFLLYKMGKSKTDLPTIISFLFTSLHTCFHQSISGCRLRLL